MIYGGLQLRVSVPRAVASALHLEPRTPLLAVLTRTLTSAQRSVATGYSSFDLSGSLISTSLPSGSSATATCPHRVIAGDLRTLAPTVSSDCNVATNDSTVKPSLTVLS